MNQQILNKTLFCFPLRLVAVFLNLKKNAVWFCGRSIEVRKLQISNIGFFSAKSPGKKITAMMNWLGKEIWKIFLRQIVCITCSNLFIKNVTMIYERTSKKDFFFSIPCMVWSSGSVAVLLFSSKQEFGVSCEDIAKKNELFDLK